MPFRLLAFASALALSGCVAIDNGSGLTPPLAFVSHLRATVGVPRQPVECAELKSGRTDASVHVKEWVFTGISADIVDMAIAKAANDGRLKKIHYADYEMTSYLGFVTVFNLVAYGE